MPESDKKTLSSLRKSFHCCTPNDHANGKEQVKFVSLSRLPKKESGKIGIVSR
jgi:hypothetical protein